MVALAVKSSTPTLHAKNAEGHASRGLEAQILKLSFSASRTCAQVKLGEDLEECMYRLENLYMNFTYIPYTARLSAFSKVWEFLGILARISRTEASIECRASGGRGSPAHSGFGNKREQVGTSGTSERRLPHANG
jgi:hypothetical protein